MIDFTRWTALWFPERRFDLDFPLPLWFAGLWFYLKSFLYLCYVWMAGMDPPPYPTAVIVETIYFGAMIVPSLLLGLAMWNDKKRFIVPALVLLGIDTPFLFFHVLRLAEAGFLASDLTRVMEIGALILNVIAFGWLIGYLTAYKAKTARNLKTNPK